MLEGSAGRLSPRRVSLRPYLELMRPPNLTTAAADVLAGFAAGGFANPRALPWLLASTICLYGGGVVLNDVFDAGLDARERPERPIPSGRATVRAATRLGIALLGMGVAAGVLASARSAVIALFIAGSAVLYDAWGKKRPLGGPFNMGVCRGLNLLLGLSAAPVLLGQRWPLALIPLVYIAGVTAVSRGEVLGGDRRSAAVALALLGAVITALAALSAAPGVAPLGLLPLLLLLIVRVLPPYLRAYRRPDPATVRTAVRAGVLSLIVLDAAVAGGYAGLAFGLAVLALLAVAAGLARLFAVT